MGFLWARRLIVLVGQTIPFSSAGIVFTSLHFSRIWSPSAAKASVVFWVCSLPDWRHLIKIKEVIVDRLIKPLVTMCQIHWSLNLFHIFPWIALSFKIFLMKPVLEKVVGPWTALPPAIFSDAFNLQENLTIAKLHHLRSVGSKERYFSLPTVAAEFTIYCSPRFIWDKQRHQLLCLCSHLLVFHPCSVKTFC